MDSLLVDSSFLYAAYDSSDHHHRQALAFARHNPLPFRIPDVALPEVAFLFARSGGVPAVVNFLKELHESRFALECLQQTDLERARQVMARYPEARLDFVDCAIVALAERLNVTRVCTFDRRDFGIVRPSHCDFLQLLP
jgi:predicted nucleic acid-binding protein